MSAKQAKARGGARSPGVSSVKPAEFLAAVSVIPCKLTLDKWQEIVSVRSPSEGEKARAAIRKADLAALDAFEKLSAAEIEKLQSSLAKSSVFRAVTAYRNHFKEAGYSNHPVLWFFRLNKKDYANRRGAYKRKVKRDMQDLRPLFDADGYLRKALYLLGTDSYINVAMGLCAVTGRRPGEILVTANFKKTGENTVIFSGQLKGKGGIGARDNYEIFTLIPADTVIQALDKLRKMVDFSGEKINPGETLGQAVNRKTANAQNKAVRRYFIEFIPDYQRGNKDVISLKSYNLRAAYGMLAIRYFFTDWMESQENRLDASEESFISELLGHSEDDTATAQSYVDFTDMFVDTVLPFPLRGGPVNAKNVRSIAHG